MSTTDREWTPGPWKAIIWGNEQYPYPLSINSENGESWIAREGTTSSLANAHLIAAAPDLYEALESISEQYENQDLNHKDFRVGAKHIAEAALAKARGQS